VAGDGDGDEPLLAAAFFLNHPGADGVEASGDSSPRL